jgi:hypothetical protein
MTSWSAAEKVDFTLAGGGQIHGLSPEGRFLQTLLSTECGKRIQTLVEIGTWNGLGSTLCMLQGIQGTEYTDFVSLECNKDKHMAALENLEPYLEERTRLLWGSIVDTSIVGSPAYMAQFPTLLTETNVRSWFDIDLQNCRESPCCLSEIPQTIDFLLLDGGEYTTLYEFDVLFPRCVQYIALDDVLIDKCREVRARLLSDSDWEEIFFTENRNGFCVFQKKGSH